jgi:hypothetical protein
VTPITNERLDELIAWFDDDVPEGRTAKGEQVLSALRECRARRREWQMNEPAEDPSPVLRGVAFVVSFAVGVVFGILVRIGVEILGR